MRLYNGLFSLERGWSSLISSVKCKVTRHQWRYVNSSPVFLPEIPSSFDFMRKKIFLMGYLKSLAKITGVDYFTIRWYN